MPYRDSLDKIVKSYFWALAREPFSYKGDRFTPKRLIVSPLIFRHYTCPALCGACCPRFSLIYLPHEPRPASPHIRNRVAQVGRVRLTLREDAQTDHDGHYCRHLDRTNGLCGVHGRQPFTCDFELLRVLHHDDHSVLIQKLYGRAWNMLRIDGERGARCEMIEQTPEQRADLLRRLGRLREWLNAFEIDSHIDTVIDWCAAGPHAEPLILTP